MSTNQYSVMYRELISLVEMCDAFFFKDVTLDDVHYRMFNYRLCSYTDFLLPSALDCRGIMFEISAMGECIDISSRPMQKFWNDKENPFTENVDYSKTVSVMTKADGSLISSYMHKGVLRLKTKGSIDSEQALSAMQWLSSDDNQKLYDDIKNITDTGTTVNMEWTSPNNRIVLGYEKDGLIILNAINNYTGEYMHHHNFPMSLRNIMVDDILDGIDDIDKFISGIYSKVGIEGYVIRLEDGQMVKLKTEWYLNLHRNKESVNSPKRLLEAIINETADDLLTLFTDDPASVNIINDMIVHVEPIFNNIISLVEIYFRNNKDLSRKDYAIKAKSLDDGLMCLYMNEYSGKVNDYKKFAIRNFEMFIGEQ